MSAHAPSLAERLALEPLETDRFRSDPGPSGSRAPGRVFGGLLAAQALVAAGRSVANGRVHSLHGYFLRPARYGLPLEFEVERIREGIGVSSRRVVIHQDAVPVFHLAASFHVEDGGIAHQAPMPEAPPPAELEDWDALRARLMQAPPTRRAPDALEMRLGLREGATPDGGGLLAWLRPRLPLPDDPLLHAASLVYASDGLPLGAVARAHDLAWRRGGAASLDHSVWLHGPVRFDDWVLYATHSPAAHAGRALAFGSIYASDGRRLASVAQEGMLR